MSVAIVIEQAQVYRGGRRRWFSLRAACRAEASMLHRQHFRQRCDCDKPSQDGIYPGNTCAYHETDFFHRWTARVARGIERQHKDAA